MVCALKLVYRMYEYIHVQNAHWKRSRGKRIVGYLSGLEVATKTQMLNEKRVNLSAARDLISAQKRCITNAIA